MLGYKSSVTHAHPHMCSLCQTESRVPPLSMCLCVFLCVLQHVLVFVMPGFSGLRLESRCNFLCTKTSNKWHQGREEHITGSSSSAPLEHRELQALLTYDQVQPLRVCFCVFVCMLREAQRYGRGLAVFFSS